MVDDLCVISERRRRFIRLLLQEVYECLDYDDVISRSVLIKDNLLKSMKDKHKELTEQFLELQVIVNKSHATLATCQLQI